MSNTGGVFISGASSGIGEACALGLDELGYDVFAGVRNEEDGKLLCQKASKRLRPVIIDITNPEQIKAAAESAIKEAPAELLHLYGSLIGNVQKHVKDIEKTAQSPQIIVRAVVHALTARRPKTRYLIGPRARPQKVISWLPDNIQDRIMASFLNWGK